jgi:hypothetical protein
MIEILVRFYQLKYTAFNLHFRFISISICVCTCAYYVFIKLANKVRNILQGVMISKSRGAQTFYQQLHPELPESTKQLLNSVLNGTLESYLDKSFGSNPPSTEPLSEAGQTAITSTVR